MMKNPKVQLILGIVCGLVIIGMVGFIYYRSISTNRPTGSTPIPTQAPLSTEQKRAGVIAKVGNEYLYQKDLDLEIQYSPPMPSIDQKKFFLDKMTRDSVILQGALEDRLIDLDITVFNSPDKDYLKRSKLVQKAESMITDRSESTSGTIITIWFLNSNMPSLLGYEKGKEVSLQKITALYNDVKSKKITISQALERNKNDSSRHELDSAWQANPGYIFSVSESDTITFDKEFDKKIRALNKGELTEVTALKEITKVEGDGKPVDVMYAFAEVTEKKTNALKPLDQWLVEKRQRFPVTNE